MVFSSLIFIFAFLGLCHILYAFAPGIKSKNIVLLVFSLIFYAWGGPALLLLLIGMTLVCYLGALLIEKIPKRRVLWLVLTLVISLGLLAFFKYTGFFLSNLQSLFGFPTEIPSITLPIGISFYTFQLISYVIDVYKKEVPAQKKYWLLLLYASLFHQCIAGPIVRYADVNRDINEREIKLCEVSQGVSRFAIGLAKKAILANGCGVIADSILAPNGAMMNAEQIKNVPALALFIACLCYVIQLYLDFSAYSDMAIGMGLMVGFHYKENFNYPYVAHSVTDFWRRWHISLSSFFRDYVYIPLGGNRVSIPRHILNMLVVWALTGFWHGANWSYILWGLYWFVFLILEKYVFKIPKNPKLPIRILGTAGTLIITFFGMTLFKFTDIVAFGQTVFSMIIPIEAGFFDTATTLLFKNNVFFLVAAVIACTPIIPFIGKLCQKNKVTAFAHSAAASVMPVILIAISALALAGDSYNPFLYFQF